MSRLEPTSQTDIEQRLLYGLAHDMGAPLRSVVQFSGLLLDRLDSRLDDKERFWLKLVAENGARSQTMLAALLHYTKLASERQEGQPIDVDQAIANVLSELQAKLREAGAVVHSRASNQYITGDRAQFEELLKHLLNNALTYQRTGNAAQIAISASSIANQFELLVEDNGIGVKPKDYEQISSPFSRLHGAEEYPGIGMGLAHCWRIVDLAGGHISFNHSALGGLAVHCRMPLRNKGDAPC
ncbi:hypothetical protein A3709_07790 [Halioglobus sp. HI00S01]|uniref:sensor histidine kinase n=1 Tax=Halioglobus sp. HI00S01 TaxID=1822214 RepID=UPI0007C302DA|nr:ATP-binding protein [Halioglobus sp. HI00S01]KZX54913.1 hypothetical protein A3709_07790 [Halioglobus sp. HI00S01]